MSCIRDPDRLAVHRRDSDGVRPDADARQPNLTDEPLQDWLHGRLFRGDIRYVTTENGIDIYRILRPLYED